MQTTSWPCYYCHKLRFFKSMESFKGLFHLPGNCMFLICIRLWTSTTSDQIHPLNIRKREPYKIFKIFNIESYPWYTLQLSQFIKPANWGPLNKVSRLPKFPSSARVPHVPRCLECPSPSSVQVISSLSSRLPKCSSSARLRLRVPLVSQVFECPTSLSAFGVEVPQ